MAPEQIPGTLFVLLTAWVGMSYNQDLAVLILALGCAAGWQTYNPHPTFASIARLVALALWTIGFLIILQGVF